MVYCVLWFVRLVPFGLTAGLFARAGRRLHRPRWGLVACTIVAALAFGSYRMLRGTSERLAIGRSEQLTADAGLEIQPAISPAGNLVAYAAGNAAPPNARCRNVRRGSFMMLPPRSALRLGCAIRQDAQLRADYARFARAWKGPVSPPGASPTG